MSKQFKVISVLAARNRRNSFEIAELLSASFALLYGLWVVYPTPDAARLLAVDAYSASFFTIGIGQFIGMAQHRYRLRLTMGLLAVPIWVFNAFYSSGPAQLVFPAIAMYALFRISRRAERTSQRAKVYGEYAQTANLDVSERSQSRASRRQMEAVGHGD